MPVAGRIRMPRLIAMAGLVKATTGNLVTRAAGGDSRCERKRDTSTPATQRTPPSDVPD